MPTDWRDARLDRLSERVDRIEDERRDEKQRFYNRCLYAMFLLLWTYVVVIVVIVIVNRVH